MSQQPAKTRSGRRRRTWLFVAAGVGSLVVLAAVAQTAQRGISKVPVKPSAQLTAPVPAPTPVPPPTRDPIMAEAGNLPSTVWYSYHPETAHSVSQFAGPFRDFGGVAAFGYPLTEPFPEKSVADGKWRWVQYFEKAVLEYHPDLRGSNTFQVASLGSIRLAQKYPNGVPPSKPPPGDGSYTFPETGHTVNGSFLQRWHEGGEVRRFGYPISGTFEEVSAANGQAYTVQYFERTVMEHHPEEKPPYDVQLVALGSIRLAEAYPSGVPRNAANPIPSPTVDPAIAFETSNTIRYIATSTALALRVQATNEAVTLGMQATATYKVQTGYVENRITAVALTAQAQPSGGCTTQVRVGALCRDGTTSSATGRGACSRHGGVSQWLYDCP